MQKEYENLFIERPEAFSFSPELEIITDDKLIEQLEAHTEKKIGVNYKSDYNIMVVDLVKDKRGKLFAYERVMHSVKAPSVVCVPIYNNNIVLLKQFRHALRDYQLCVLRGFGKCGLTAEENVKKEIWEELGAQCLTVKFLGNIVADSGLSGERVAAFMCKISEPIIDKGYEGMKKLVCVTPEEFYHMAKTGKINDGFTLAAMSLIRCLND